MSLYRARQLYHMVSLHLSSYPVVTAWLKAEVKETYYSWTLTAKKEFFTRNIAVVFVYEWRGLQFSNQCLNFYLFPWTLFAAPRIHRFESMYVITKLLYLLKWMPYSYISYTILKPVHFHLVSDFNMGLYASATWKTQARRFSLRSREEQRKNCLELIALVHQVFLVLIDGFPFWPDPSE